MIWHGTDRELFASGHLAPMLYREPLLQKRIATGSIGHQPTHWPSTTTQEDPERRKRRRSASRGADHVRRYHSTPLKSLVADYAAQQRREGKRAANRAAREARIPFGQRGTLTADERAFALARIAWGDSVRKVAGDLGCGERPVRDLRIAYERGLL